MVELEREETSTFLYELPPPDTGGQASRRRVGRSSDRRGRLERRLMRARCEHDLRAAVGRLWVTSRPRSGPTGEHDPRRLPAELGEAAIISAILYLGREHHLHCELASLGDAEWPDEAEYTGEVKEYAFPLPLDQLLAGECA
jgi:hypothetical protein